MSITNKGKDRGPFIPAWKRHKVFEPPKIPSGIPLLEGLIHLTSDVLGEMAAEADSSLSGNGGAIFPEYQGRPVQFIKEKLGEEIPDDILEMIQSVRSSPITLSQAANGVGKTWAAARLIVWHFLCFPRSQTYTAAAPPEDNLKMLLWGEIGSIVEKHPKLFDGCSVSLASMSIKRSSQHFIVGVTIPNQGTPKDREARFSGKHAPYIMFVIDEGDAVPPEVYNGIEACMSGGHARLLVLFNPRQEAGPVYAMQKRSQGKTIRLTAFTHPNVITGEDLFPGAVTRAVTVRRINLWTRPLSSEERPDAECFEVPSFLVGERAQRDDGAYLPPLKAGWRKVTEQSFWYMVMARYPAMAENQLISATWINNAVARWQQYVSQNGEIPPRLVRPICGLDIAERGADSNVFTLRFGSFVARQITWNGIDLDETEIKAAGIYKANNALYCNTDATGLGAGVWKHMRKLGALKAHRIMVASAPTTNIDDQEEKERIEDLGQFELVRDYMLWQLREWLRTDPSAMIPPDEELLEELLVPTYSKTLKEIIKVTDTATMKEKIRRSPDKLMSLALTFAPTPTEESNLAYSTKYA